MKKNYLAHKIGALGLVMSMALSTASIAYAASPEENMQAVLNDEFISEMCEDYAAENQDMLSSLKSTEQTGEILLDDIVQYAVDEGYIADTPEQRAAITTEVMRWAIGTAADLADTVLGYSTAADFLNHSLQDNPSDLRHFSDSEYAIQIKNSDEFQEILEEAKADVKKAGTSIYRSYTGYTYLNSTTDLRLAYNNVSYRVQLSRDDRTTKTWTMTLTIYDTYDYDFKDWSEALEGIDDALVTLINNIADAAYDNGIIQGYDITVYMPKTTFTV